MPPELIYGCSHLCCIFHPWWVFIPVHKTKYSTWFLYFSWDIYSAIAFLLKLSILSLSSYRSLKRVTSISSFVFHRRKGIMQVWNDMRASTTISVSYCLLSVCKDQHLLRGWFIMSHYSKVCKRFFTFPFFMQVESDWLLLFSWNLKQGYYS